MGSSPGGRIVLIGGLACIALLCWFILARGSAGWPGMWGFGGDAAEWHAVWIAFWAGAFPTIVTAVVIAIAAGLYLNDRERRLDRLAEERATRQRYREQLDQLLLDLAHAIEESVDIRFGDPPSAGDVRSPRIQAVHTVLVSHPWPLWRAHLPDAAPLFDLLQDVAAADRRLRREAHLFDRDLSMSVRLVRQKTLLDASDPLGPTFEWIEETQVHKYVIGCAMGQRPAAMALKVLGDVRYEPDLAAIWGAAQRELRPSAERAAAYARAYQRLIAALRALEARMRAVMGPLMDQEDREEQQREQGGASAREARPTPDISGP